MENAQIVISTISLSLILYIEPIQKMFPLEPKALEPRINS